MQTKQYPFYLKATIILFGLILLVYALFYLQGILVPLAFAIIISILLNPLMNRIQKTGLPRVVSILLTIIIAGAFICTIFYFLSSQIARFSDTLPLLKERFNELTQQFSHYLESNFGIGIQKQLEVLNRASENNKGIIQSTVGSALGAIGLLLLIPVYIFLFLFYKPLILNFLYEVFSEEHSQVVVSDILRNTKSAIQSYMIGLLLEATIVAALNSTALMILGVDYAILLGVMGALLNMLPYIGGLIAIALPVLMATITKDGYQTQLAIIAAYMVIQFIDNNILVPRIVSSKVQINALMSIVIVLLGGSLWGLSGMFLSIPFIAIVKIIFDRIDGLKPWGKLLGDEVPTKYKGHLWKKNIPPPSVAEEIVAKS